ncbi:MAG TPA: acyltransferase [Candidatus Polarisedimenticolia bacterium]|nr:acyltransferase [Candidatus Polarisedimenticolia bacterium]
MPSQASPSAARGEARYPASLTSGLASRRIPGLDGMRALGSFAVIAYHYTPRWAPGGLGVMNFLVLSGFLITWLLLGEEDRKGTIGVGGFYVRRTRHIVPAFFVFMIAVTAALMVFDKRIVWPQVITAFLFVVNYWQGIAGDPNTAFSHTWALALELQFYLLWPLLFLALRRDRRRMAGTLVVIIAAIWAYRSLMWLSGAVPQGYVYEAFDMRADHLLLGCLVAVLLKTGSMRPIVSVLTDNPVMPLLTMTLIGASAVCEKIWGVDYRNIFGFIVNPILLMTLLLQAITFATTPGWRWLEWGWVRYLGTISYSVYLYQQVIVSPVQERLGFLPEPLTFLATLAAVYAVSSAAYFLVEKPLRRSPKSGAHAIAGTPGGPAGAAGPAPPQPAALGAAAGPGYAMGALRFRTLEAEAPPHVTPGPFGPGTSGSAAGARPAIRRGT